MRPGPARPARLCSQARDAPAAAPPPFPPRTAALEYWARKTPDRIWLAERSGAGWRTVTFAEAAEMVAVLAHGLANHGVAGPQPLLILAMNGIDNALIAYAAMSQGVPIAPVSPQYGLRG